MDWHTAFSIKHLHAACKQKIARGFTLLEVLIALLVFSIGLLGLGGLQLLGYKMTADSLLRSVATILANDMIDRMRANVTATSLGLSSPYNNPAGVATGNPACLGENNVGAQINTSCTSTQMAGHDFYEWMANISGATATAWNPAVPAQLPQGTGVVCIDSTPNDGTPAAPGCDGVMVDPNTPVFCVKIWWVERKDANSPGTMHRYVASFSM